MNVKINGYLSNRWNEESGYRQVLAMAFPLILSTGSWSIQHFVDRMFLTWYSPEAVAASMPAGLFNWTIMSLFIGTASYTSTFVAQYYGAKRYDRVGPSIWQGLYVGLIGGVFLLAAIPLAPVIFKYAGHEPLVRQYEIAYFQILCYGAAPAIAASAMSGLFSGLGRPWALVWINALATLVNVVLDYLMIFGRGGFPELGVKGAAIATVMSAVFSLIAYLFLFYRGGYDEKYHLFRGWRFDGPLFARLLKFGFPSGVQFFLDVAGFTAFIFFIGRLGTINLASTNIAFNINTLAFMPMIGVGIAISVLVGQNLGRNQPGLAEKAVYSGFHLTFLYMTTVAALYFFLPNLFITPFLRGMEAGKADQIRQIAIVLLRFVALYSIFDTMNIVFSSALRGAGDTRYVMYMIVAVSSLVLVIPTYVALVIFQKGLYFGWTIASLYVILLGFSFLVRFLGGKWKAMRVIEEVTPFIPPSLPESPAMDID